MFIHRNNLSNIKADYDILKRRIILLCNRIQSLFRVILINNSSIFDNLELHLLDKILISKYALTKNLYNHLKKSYKEMIQNYNSNNRKKSYVFTLKRIIRHINE